MAFSGQAQVVSQFTWDNSPVTNAVVGPNATGYGGFATSVSGGVGGTNGLAANGHDINMTMAGSTYNSMPGVDISIDFLKRENGASFFTLGNFDFGITTGAIYVKFTVNIGGTITPMNSNAGFLAPNDGVFHTYRFVYNNVTGIGTLSLDGVTKATYTIAAGSPLVWGAGNATIGSLMDGSGSTLPEIDNLIIQNPPIILALALVSLDAVAAGSSNQLSWAVAGGTDVSEFVVERSGDGVKYSEIGVVAALKGNTVYSFADASPAAANFYRIKIVSADGISSYSAVKKVGGTGAVAVSCWPNPVVNFVNVKVSGVGPVGYTLFTLDGKVMQSGTIVGGHASLDVSRAPKGMMIVRVESGQSVETYKIAKL
jgi:hypothetical protein